MLSVLSCSKTDIDDRSFFENEFQRCYFSKEYINGVIYREAIYVDEIDYQIDYVQYYDQGRLRPDWTEYYEYEQGKLQKRDDGYYSWTYMYNDLGDIQRITFCTGNGTYCSVSDYEYKGNTLIAIHTRSPNSQPINENIQYTNEAAQSYYSFVYQNNILIGVEQYQTFPELIVNPLEKIELSGLNNYQTWIVNNSREGTFETNYIDSIDILKGRYPTAIAKSKLDPKTLDISTTVYNYEYVGCK